MALSWPTHRVRHFINPLLGGNMRKLIMAIIAAAFAAVSASAFADDVKTDPAKAAAKPGRQIDEGTVKTDPSKAASKPGRQANEEKAAPKKSKKKKKGADAPKADAPSK
jgi:Ni/Co efflux regulator RcnB